MSKNSWKGSIVESPVRLRISLPTIIITQLKRIRKRHWIWSSRYWRKKTIWCQIRLDKFLISVIRFFWYGKSDDEESRSFECLQRSPAEAERDGWRKTEDGFWAAQVNIRKQRISFLCKHAMGSARYSGECRYGLPKTADCTRWDSSCDGRMKRSGNTAIIPSSIFYRRRFFI